MHFFLLRLIFFNIKFIIYWVILRAHEGTAWTKAFHNISHSLRAHCVFLHLVHTYMHNIQKSLNTTLVVMICTMHPYGGAKERKAPFCFRFFVFVTHMDSFLFLLVNFEFSQCIFNRWRIVWLRLLFYVFGLIWSILQDDDKELFIASCQILCKLKKIRKYVERQAKGIKGMRKQKWQKGNGCLSGMRWMAFLEILHVRS